MIQYFTYRYLSCRNILFPNSWLLGVVFISLFNSRISLSQTSNAELLVSQSGICNGNVTQIQASTNGTFLGWSVQGNAPTQISSPYSLTSDIQPIVATTYTATAQFIGDNLISNGDFEMGKQGFSSNYSYRDTSGFKSGIYTITNNPFGLSNSYILHSDHTSGFGKMFLADGAQDSTKAAYKTKFKVQAGTTYLFTIWMANAHVVYADTNPIADTTFPTPPFLLFQIDSSFLGQYQFPVDTFWHSFSVAWTAPSSKSVALTISDRNIKIKGNDFAMDDISFQPIVTKQASITVQPCNHADVFSPNGDGQMDTYYIEDTGTAKIFDVGGKLIRELQAPGNWDGLENSGAPANIGYYAIVVGGSKVSRVSLVR